MIDFTDEAGLQNQLIRDSNWLSHTSNVADCYNMSIGCISQLKSKAIRRKILKMRINFPGPEWNYFGPGSYTWVGMDAQLQFRLGAAQGAANRAPGPPWAAKVVVETDSSEEVSGIPALLRDAGAQVLSRRLPAGDYLVGQRVLVERKSAGDFAQSLYDGRLFRQLRYLKRAPMAAWLVVEGGSGCYESFWPPGVRSALLSIAMWYRVPTLFTRRPEGTALLLLELGRRCMPRPQEDSFEPSDRVRSRGRRLRKILEAYDALTKLPGIGRSRALRLMGHVGLLAEMRGAEENEFLRVPGIGTAHARMILESLKKG